MLGYVRLELHRDIILDFIRLDWVQRKHPYILALQRENDNLTIFSTNRTKQLPIDQFLSVNYIRAIIQSK